MAKQINIGSMSGIDEAIAFLKGNMSKKALQKKADEVATALVDEGKQIAEAEYPEVVEVTVDHNPGEHKLTATHEGIAFIEFGAGWGVDANNEFAKAPGSPDVAVGSWSDAHKGMFHRTGHTFWLFGKTVFTRVDARPGMELAREHIVDNAEKKLKEVFSGD